jgi:hypothetical protein
MSQSPDRDVTAGFTVPCGEVPSEDNPLSGGDNLTLEGPGASPAQTDPDRDDDDIHCQILPSKG